jgi:hypothetical protein
MIEATSLLAPHLNFHDTVLRYRFLRPFQTFEIAVRHRDRLVLAGDIHPGNPDDLYSDAYYALTWPTNLSPIGFLQAARDYYDFHEQRRSQGLPPRRRKALSEGVFIVMARKQELFNFEGKAVQHPLPLEVLHALNAATMYKENWQELEAIHVGLLAADLVYERKTVSREESAQTDDLSIPKAAFHAGLMGHQKDPMWLFVWLMRTHAAAAELSEADTAEWERIIGMCLQIFNQPQVWK